MYKLLLCLRYLRTRYIALASIISVTLGVATMIVVNSVMAGFTTEMKDRIRGLLADVVIETHSLQGHENPEGLIARAMAAAPGMIEAATPTVEMYAVMSFDYGGEPIHRPVQLIGIDPRGKSKVGPLKENLASYQPVMKDGKVVEPAQRSLEEELGWNLTPEAMELCQRMHDLDVLRHRLASAQSASQGGGILPASAAGADWGADSEEWVGDSQPYASEGGSALVPDPFAAVAPAPAQAPESRDGLLDGRVMIGKQLISVPIETADGSIEERLLVQPGQRVTLTTVKAGSNGPPESATMNATVTDVFKSGMSEYDSRVVFCNIERLQEVRGMLVPDENDRSVTVGREIKALSGPHAGQSGQVVRLEGPYAVVRLGSWHEPGEEITLPKTDCLPLSRSVTTVQIKLKEGVDPAVAVAALKQAFPAERFSVGTWESKQGPLLAAVDMETTILNVLLFLIVAVAGFGILAIFYMIVVEKTRDIGILKALGAGSRGIMSIFLSYGISLGLVGAGAGVVLGLLFVRYINEVEKFISYLTGREVFDERIYYFPEIPTRVDPLTVFWVALGAVFIAVAASILPARRAAALHPVQALRYE
ncbi:FtsX-like permease family protein [Alienimonas californiensis]|uniref:Lipoprotein-releasing system transmembrane protein LolC n=1 Tax=Alienimonas californiensis TaxID=2527989 RepID=A0A517PAE9_9PLAN|nr:FtsX-like permease family protein [Alienimonas californiensis]QDT16346.1 Lipoprotein-releasing system transmembrane protein LolC [Alienimonas californiensis]